MLEKSKSVNLFGLNETAPLNCIKNKIAAPNPFFLASTNSKTCLLPLVVGASGNFANPLFSNVTPFTSRK